MEEASTSGRAYLVAEQLSWNLPDGEPLLSGVSLSVGSERTGLVGRNGAGKSTLLRLLLGELAPGEGKVRVQGKVAYLPQGFTFAPEMVVADALGIQARLGALERITAGSCDPEDFTTLDDDWNVMERTRLQLEELGLGHLELERRMATLSGGETTRVLMARLLLQRPDVLLLDEPTNNLDARSREALYQMLARWRGGAVAVTHDRELLMHVDRILELSTLGLKVYGGNYEDYLAQKEAEEEAALRRLKDAQKTIKKTQREIQETRERHQQREAQGRHLRKTGSQSKLFLNAQRERSEQTKSGMAIRAERQLEAARKELNESRGQVELMDKSITVDLEATEVPRRKLVLELRDVSFTWPGGARPMLDGLDLTLVGPERMCIAGSNGSGKTTLTRLILGQLQPDRGTVKVGVEHVAYLDQHARLLDDELSILENFRRYNPEMKESDRRLFLAHFLFRNDAALQRVGTLSGGERLRASLACVLVSSRTPQLLILDEPTNHLDLESIESVERILKSYQGALLVISHDQHFLENIQVTSTLNLDSIRKTPSS